MDVAVLLATCDGNAALARRLLQGFVAEQGQGLDDWQRALQAGELPVLARLAHTLRGLAGSFGARALVAAAAQVEQAATQPDAAAAMLALQALGAPSGPLARLVAAIDGALAPLPAPPAAAEAGLLDLQELERWLHDSDSRAVAWCQAHEAALRRQLHPAQARRLLTAVQRYDFDVALLALQGADTGQFAESTT